MTMIFITIEPSGFARNPFGKVQTWHSWDPVPSDRGTVHSVEHWPVCTCGHIAENHNSPCIDPENYRCDGGATPCPTCHNVRQCPCTGYEPSGRWQDSTLEQLKAKD